MSGGWLKLHRGRGEALALLLRHPHALALLTLLATRARFSAGLDPATGIELQVGEALTGRGDAAAIGATPKQYRVCKDQLMKWGFVATSRATKGATWGTVLRLTESAIYEVVPLNKGHQDGRQEGHAGATWGPPEGHEHRTKEHKEQETTPDDEQGGGGDAQDKEIQDYILLVLAREAMKADNPGSYREGGLKRLKSQGWRLLDRDQADLAAARTKAEEIKKYELLKTGGGQIAAPDTPQQISSATWDEARSLIQGKLSASDFNLWIDPLLCVYDDAQGIKLAGTDPYFCSWVRENYLTHIQEALPGRDVNVIFRGVVQLAGSES